MNTLLTCPRRTFTPNRTDGLGPHLINDPSHDGVGSGLTLLWCRPPVWVLSWTLAPLQLEAAALQSLLQPGEAAALVPPPRWNKPSPPPSLCRSSVLLLGSVPPGPRPLRRLYAPSWSVVLQTGAPLASGTSCSWRRRPAAALQPWRPRAGPRAWS